MLAELFMAIFDSVISRFVSRRFVVCDKSEYLHNAMDMIERCAASHILVMDRATMVRLVAHPQIRGFIQLATVVN